MDASSSDGLEIVEPSSHSDTHAPPTHGLRPLAARTSPRSAAQTRPNSGNRHEDGVIELGDSSDEEQPLPTHKLTDEADDDVVVLGGLAAPSAVRIKRPWLHPSSEDSLPSANALWGAHDIPVRASAHATHRSASVLDGRHFDNMAPAKSLPLARAHTLGARTNAALPSVALLTSSPLGLSPPHPQTATNGMSSPPSWTRTSPRIGAAEGGHRSSTASEARPALFRSESPADGSNADAVDSPAAARVSPPPKPDAADDLWADILVTPREKEKAKGKDREVPEPTNAPRARIEEGGLGTDAGTRKRVASFTDRDAEQEGSLGRSKAHKASRISTEPPIASTAYAATVGLSKTALKKLETAERVRLRKANTLRAGDKKASTAELTMHVSGRAFSLAGEMVGVDSQPTMVADRPKTAGGSKRARTQTAKPSPWLEITREVRERLSAYACDVVDPSTGADRDAADLGGDVEGAVRWTRRCDRMWSDERRMFVPLQDGQKLIAEEDTRLVFLSALDLSTHIANGTLSEHLSTLKSRLGAQVTLFILLFGLPSLFRDLERARQEAYRNSVRAEGARSAVRPAGIGDRQPTKDELEFALIRVQMESRCMLVSVDKVSEAVDWLEQLTLDVGQKPYQRLKHSHVALLGTAEDKVQSGKDLQDTYLRMLASLPRVTEPVAKGIVAEYPTVRDLYEAWEACGDDHERKRMLVGIGKGRNLNGTATHRMIGKDLSATIYRIMTSRDPNMHIQ